MENKALWFNNVTVTSVHNTNGWNVVSFQTKSGHSVRGITKYDVNVAAGQVRNIKISNGNKVTYINAIIEKKEAA